MPKIAHLRRQNEITPTKVKSQVLRTPNKQLASKGNHEGTPTKVKNHKAKPTKKQLANKENKKPQTSTVIALAKVVSCDDLGFDKRAELNVHENGNGTFSVRRLLK